MCSLTRSTRRFRCTKTVPHHGQAVIAPLAVDAHGDADAGGLAFGQPGGPPEKLKQVVERFSVGRRQAQAQAKGQRRKYWMRRWTPC